MLAAVGGLLADHSLNHVLGQLVPYIGAAIAALTLAMVYRLTGKRLDELQVGSQNVGQRQGESSAAQVVRTEIRNGVESKLTRIESKLDSHGEKLDDHGARLRKVEERVL